ncbi:hypothetical protein RIF29_10925 [Crotalaria pallida]|uniref:Uncharacterized protein n=1 Tax=Crotalaria pallida TaxID=3830 RepID=A0AAN9FW94_CROPI
MATPNQLLSQATLLEEQQLLSLPFGFCLTSNTNLLVSVLCITFGSPLLGNKSFSNAILAFSKKDGVATSVTWYQSMTYIMPRLLFASTLPHTAQLNHLLQFWQLSMTGPSFGKLAAQVTGKEKAELFNFVMSYLNQPHDHKMEKGLKHFCFIHLDVTSLFQKKGHYVWKLNIPDSSCEAGLEFAVQSVGLANQLLNLPWSALRLRRMCPSPTQNVAHLAVTLSKVVPCDKAWCDQQSDQMGYYDLFKRRGSSKRGMKVNMNRHKLATPFAKQFECL